jgi:hypothetical protein
MNPQRLVALIALVVVTILGSGARPRRHERRPVGVSKGYLLTGGYVASGSISPKARTPSMRPVSRLSTIHIHNVPIDADIVAAYMYFETITEIARLSDQ